MNEKDVFISYKAEELNEAMWVRDRLEEQGISCWLAPGSIPGGSSYAVQIPKAIRECVAFVLILSNNAQASKWVPRELDQAINANKVILPFSIENCALKDEFSFYLSNVQRYEAWKNRDKAFASMVRVIKTLIKERDDALAEEARAAQIRAELENAAKAAAAAGNAPAANAGAPAGTIPANAGAAPAGFAGAPGNGTPGYGVPGSGVQQNPGMKQNIPGTNAGAAPAGKKKKGSAGRILLIAGAVIAALVIGFFAVNAIRSAQKEKERIANTFIISGKEVLKTDSSIYLKDAEVTEEDLQRFAIFEKLTSVTMENCTISAADLSPVLNENLTRLIIIGCGLTTEQMKSITTNISELTSFSTLDLSDNPQAGTGAGSKDLFPAIPDSLYSIRINNTGISDLAAFAGKEKITILEAAGNGISDLTPVADLVKLGTLNIADNEVTSLEALKNCTGLSNLNVSNNPLESLEGIEACLRMETLNASGCGISEIDPLANMTVLKRVYLAENEITDIDILGKSAETLEEIDLTSNLVSSLTPLKKCASVKVLLIRNNAVETLRELSGMEALETLDASENLLNGISGLKELTHLTWIDFSDNPINGAADVAGTNWPRDKQIDYDLSNCGIISSVAINVELNYHYLDLHGNAFHDVPESVAKTSGRTIVLDWVDSMTPEAVKALQYDYVTILDMPLDQQVAFEDGVGSKLTHMTTEEYESKNEESE